MNLPIIYSQRAKRKMWLANLLIKAWNNVYVSVMPLVYGDFENARNTVGTKKMIYICKESCREILCSGRETMCVCVCV